MAIDGPLVDTVQRGGVYVRLAYTGPMPTCAEPIVVWLPSLGHPPDDAPIFEAYLNDLGPTPQTELSTDIHLPLVALLRRLALDETDRDSKAQLARLPSVTDISKQPEPIL